MVDSILLMFDSYSAKPLVICKTGLLFVGRFLEQRYLGTYLWSC